MKKVISLILVFSVIIGLITVSIVVGSATTQYYMDEFENYLFNSESHGFNIGLTYKELYYHYGEDNETQTPDWVLLQGGIPYTPSPCYAIVGDYCISRDSLWTPYDLGLFVYVPKEEKFYEFEEALKLDFGVLEAALGSCVENGYNDFYLIGDADLDAKLTVLDATYIQSAIAQIIDFSREDEIQGRCVLGDYVRYLSDFDRDGERTVLDATAIQHKLAGLEY